MNRKQWINNLAATDFGRDRKNAWDTLTSPKINWEAFKRLANQFGIDKAKVMAKKIIDKQS